MLTILQVSERDLDRVIDRVNDLNTDAPKVYVNVDEPVSPELIFGLDTKLFQLQGALGPSNKGLQEELDKHGSVTHHKNELDTMEIKCFAAENDTYVGLSLEKFEKFLGTLDKEDVYRLKGFVRLSGIKDPSSDSTMTAICVVNHAFGKWTIIPVPEKTVLEPEENGSDSPAHDHDHAHDEHHHQNHSYHHSSMKHERQVLQMHFILMGELWSIKHKLAYGCGAGYQSGEVLCEFKTSRQTIAWVKPLPDTYDDFVAEQMRLKQ